MPHSYLRGLNRKKRWTDQDRVLAVALTLHEDGLHTCGHPRGLAFEGYNEGMFEVREQTCQACAVLDQYRLEHEGKAQSPGRAVGVANLLTPNDDYRVWGGSPAQGLVDLVEAVGTHVLDVDAEGVQHPGVGLGCDGEGEP